MGFVSNLIEIWEYYEHVKSLQTGGRMDGWMEILDGRTDKRRSEKLT